MRSRCYTRPVVCRRRCRIFYGMSQLTHGTSLRQGHFDHHASFPGQIAIEGFRKRKNWFYTGIGRGKHVFPFRPRFAPNNFPDIFLNPVTVLRHYAAGNQVGPFNRLTKSGKELRFQTAETEILVIGCLIKVVKGTPVQDKFLPPQCFSTYQIGGSHHRVKGHGAVSHGDVKVLPYSHFLPVNYCRKYGNKGIV